MIETTNIPATPANNPIPAVAKPPAKNNKLVLVLGVLVFMLVAIAGVAISLKQFLVRETVAPTAPTESQAQVEKVQTCSLTFNVAQPRVGAACVKDVYRDELSNTAGDYELITEQTQFKPGEIVVYSFEVKNTGDLPATITAVDTLSVTSGDENDFSFTFLDSDCGNNAFNNSTKALTCLAENLAADQARVFTFRIRLNARIDRALTVHNLVTTYIDDEEMSGCGVEINITPEPEVSPSPTPSPSPSPTPSPSPSPSPTPEVGARCGEYCSQNADCLQENHICYFNECRLATYPDRTDCTEPSKGQVVIEETSPVAGCNESCVDNSDCSNTSHICFEGQCRLDSYPASTTCTIPSGPDQPKLPSELPKSGSEDLLNWIKVGIGILGAGALLLLL